MKVNRLLPLLPAMIFLAGAVVSGRAVSSRTTVNTFRHVEAVGSGVQRLRHFIASALYLQLDDYHHIEMYQGIPWDQVTDYLPQMWLIARLDPHFTDVYTDASFHLAVNLGRVEEGMAFVREGLANNPDSLDIRYEYTYLLWNTETGTQEEVIEQALLYRELMRRFEGDRSNPYNEPSSCTIIADCYETLADSTDPMHLYWKRRAAFHRDAMRTGLYYAGYYELPPPFILPPETMEHQ